MRQRSVERHTAKLHTYIPDTSKPTNKRQQLWQQNNQRVCNDAGQQKLKKHSALN